jgi:hypothetical protein
MTLERFYRVFFDLLALRLLAVPFVESVEADDWIVKASKPRGVPLHARAASTTATVTSYCTVFRCTEIENDMPTAYHALSAHCPVIIEPRNTDMKLKR